MRMTKHLHRRLFLRGLGGACVAAPFLSSVAERTARGQGAAAPGAPKRLIVMFTHYGCLTTQFFPASSHGPLVAADLESTTLAPLAPHVDKLLLPRGIRGMNEWTADLVRGQGNDPHTQVGGSYFTCQPVTPNSDDPFSFDAATKVNAMPRGPSLDHVMAKQLSPDGIPLFMRVGNVSARPSSAISYSAAETIFPGLGETSQIYSGLTGLFDSGGPMSPDSYQAVKGKSLIDLVKDDLDTLERFDMSQSDKLKLAAWKELLDETGTVMASAQCNAELAMKLGANPSGTGMPMGDVVAGKVTDTLDGADIYSNLAVLAAACNANPVIFIKYPGNYVYSGIGVELESHSASHRLNNANMSGTCVDGVLGMIKKIDEFYAKKFAHLVSQLDSINEGDGTLLDNSAAVWFLEMSDGNAHNLNNLPIVQAGSAGGYFKTGQSVNVEDGSASLSRGNSESQCNGESNQVNGANQSTGTPSTVAKAPINKYFCSLMNALGVKAGADGFPAPGGSAEVTHYGMYDRTEDFVGGGTKPANITDPGGFDALKANA
jgi:hypothetical protein